MSTTSHSSYTEQRSYSSAAVGVTVFAALVMIMGGVMQALQGLVALFDDNFFVLGKDYIFKFDTTTWGWIHLIVGIVVAVAGSALLRGATWARVVAVIVAAFGIVVNFLWMPYYPLWSMTLVAFDIAVIWAVTMHGRDIAER